MAKGYLLVNVYCDTIANPVEGAVVKVLKENNEIAIEKTNEDGQTNKITLETVDKSYSLEDQNLVRPYETYDVEVSALGLTPTKINGVQIFDGETSIQNIYVTSIDENSEDVESTITPNTLWKNESPNLIEESDNSTFVLDKVIIPEKIIVHDGIPSNTTAPNYAVPFVD